jgi:hypothetical protein
MNIAQANEFRVSHGLTPLPPVDKSAERKRAAANKAARAQASRDLKSKRTKGGK